MFDEIKLDTEYDNLVDIILEIIKFALEIDSIPFIIKLYDEYKQEIELAFLQITGMIVDSISKQYHKNLQITYFTDKLKLLETISFQCGVSGEVAADFCILLQNLLQQPQPINIIWNSYNPLRLITIWIKLLRIFDRIVPAMNGKIKVLEEALIDVAINIIDEINSLSALRNWLYDDLDEELKVIDYFAQLDLIRLLNLPKITQISLLIWIGIYGYANALDLANGIKFSLLGRVFRSLDVDLDSFLAVIGKGKFGNLVYYSTRILYLWGNLSYKSIFKKKAQNNIEH